MNTVFSNELQNLITEKTTQPRPVSSLSLNKYIQEYNHITKVLGKSGDWIITAPTYKLVNIINALDCSASNRLNYLNIFIMIRKGTNDIQTLLDLRDRLNKKKVVEIKEKIQNLKETLPSYEEVDKYVNQLYKNKQYVDYLINYFIWTYGLRNRDVNLTIINLKDFNEKDASKNWLVIRKLDIVLYISNYKTMGAYGLKKIVCRSRKVLDASNKLGVGNLITNKFNEPVDDNGISYYINLYDDLNESEYYKIKINYLQTQPNPIQQIAKLCETRGSCNISTLNNHYNINTKPKGKVNLPVNNNL